MPGQAVVAIKDKQWAVGVANTLTEITSGLSGVSSIPSQTGMLFDLGSDQSYIQIDMSRMLFPLDIIFINSTQGVVGVMHDIQPGEMDVRLEATTSRWAARCFLEVNTGEAQGIEVGDNVAIQGYAQPAQLNISSLFSIMFTALLVFAMFKVVGRTLKPPKERPAIPKRITEEEELQERKRTLEKVGKEMAREAGVEFLNLQEGWQGKYATPQYWFKDPKGNKIIARDVEELKWKLATISKHHSQSSTKSKPTAEDVTVDSWVERDRIGIWVTDNRTDETIAEWWNDEAREMFENGFFAEADYIRGQKLIGRKFEESVKDYLEGVDILASGGMEYLPQTKPTELNGLRVTKAYKQVSRHGEDEISVSLQAWGVFPGGRRPHMISMYQSGDLYIIRPLYAHIEHPVEVPVSEVKAWIRSLPVRHFEPMAVAPEHRERAEELARGVDKPIEILSLTTEKASQPAVIPTEPYRRPRREKELEYFADSPEYLTQTIDNTGYRQRLDSTFQEAIARVKGLR